MDYRDMIIPELKYMEKKKEFLRTARIRLDDLKASIGSIRSPAAEKLPGGGDYSVEDAILNNMAERELLEQNIRTVEAKVRWLETGLASLTEEERMILDRFFIHRERDVLERLMADLAMERSSVYRLRNSAMVSLARVLVGVVEL